MNTENQLVSERNLNKKAFKAGTFYTISNFLVKTLGFLTMPIFTRIMSKSDIGYFSNLQSWISILSILCSLELSSSIALAKYDYKGEFDRYVSSNLFLSNVFTIFCYLSIFFVRDTLLPMMGLSDIEFHLCFLYLLTYSGLQMFQQKQQVLYQYKKSVFVSLISALTSTLLSVVLVLTISDKYFGRLIGYFSPLIAIYLFISIVLYFKGRCISPKYWKYALKISVPIIFHLVAGFILSTSDRVMITNICGAEQNAYYSVAYSVASIVQLLWMSVNSALAPWAIDQMYKQNYDLLKKVTRIILILFGICCVFYSLISPELLLLMGGKDYYESAVIIYPILCGCIFQAAYTFYVNAETFLKKQVLISIATIAAAAINIALNFIFIPIYGYPAAAYTTLIGYASLFLIHFVFLLVMKKSWWFDTRFVFIFLAISILICVGSVFIIDKMIVRYILLGSLIVVFGVIMWFKRKQLINLIKLFRNK